MEGEKQDMVRLSQVANELRTQFLDNITDPNTTRRRDDIPWVFTHQPNIGTLPTIQLSEVDSTFTTRSIGSVNQYERGRLQVTVRLRTQNEYDYDADNELQTASDGLNYLLTQIEETVLTNHATIISNVESAAGSGQLYSVLPDVSSGVTEGVQSDTIEKSVDFIAFMERG